MAIIVSTGPEGQDFVRYLNLSGLLAEPAPAGHRYAGIRGPYLLYLCEGTPEQVRQAAELHGGGGQYEESPLSSDDPEAPAASVIFGFPW